MATAGFLLFLTIQKAIAHHKQSIQDIAVAASAPTHQFQDVLPYGFGLTTRFDVPIAQALIHSRGEEQSRIVLQFLAAGLSIIAVVAQQKPISVSTLLEDLTVSVFLAWVTSSGYRRWWTVRRAPWWLAHAWLTWLEWQIADPSNPMGHPGEAVSLIVGFNPHPVLQQALDSKSPGGGAPDDIIGDGAIVERQVAEFARKWQHRFGSEEWRKWQMQTLKG